MRDRRRQWRNEVLEGTVSSTLLEQIILKTVDLPSMPTVAAKVMTIADSSVVSISELEEIISKDQAFSAPLLKIANSALPSGGLGRSGGGRGGIVERFEQRFERGQKSLAGSL